MALFRPGYYHHLTYWTLAVHATYFTVDKSSPNSKYLAWLLHGYSYMGAFCVMLAYTFISVCGGLHWGSWLVWENAVGAYAGTVHAPRGLGITLAQKTYEHYWPPLALAIDAMLSRDDLKRIFSGWCAAPCRPLLPACLHVQRRARTPLCGAGTARWQWR